MSREGSTAFEFPPCPLCPEWFEEPAGRGVRRGAAGRLTWPGPIDARRPPESATVSRPLAAAPALLFATVTAAASGGDAVRVTGDLRPWRTVTLSLDGLEASEDGEGLNPFTDVAFSVEFAHESGTPPLVAPGYFAADGEAGETSADAGRVWRAHLSPEKAGRWTYRVRFLTGPDAAVGGGGEAAAPWDGMTGGFDVADDVGEGPRSRGRLAYVGRHHLRHLGSGEYFLKVGADAPETLLAYADFDGTVTMRPRKAPLKTWGPHVRDWREGDPTWAGGRGKGLVGAVNYLAGEGMNAFSFLTYAAGGDGDNVWPFARRDDKLRYDCSKLDQWGVVFEHAADRGMFLHFKLSEQENSGVVMADSMAMDGGDLGPERRLYLREMVARYAHLPALNWNLGEENSQSVDQQKAMAAHIRSLDPYGHLIVTHTGGRWRQHQEVYPAMLGDRSALTGASLQTRDVRDTHRFVRHWVRASAEAGKPWVVANDKQDQGPYGTPPDPGYAGYEQTEGPTIHDVRRYALWGTLMGGGAGVEYYFGYKHPQDDLRCEDLRSRETTGAFARHARRFFVDEAVPFWDMACADGLAGGDEVEGPFCLAKPGEVYLVYLPNGGDASLDLTGDEGRYAVRWFNPRAGGPTVGGGVTQVEGGRRVALGGPPADASEDWLAVVRKEPAGVEPVSLFDGETLDGWNGAEGVWRVEDGAIVAGSASEAAPQNEFLCTDRRFDDFDLRLKFRISDGAAKANAGVQFRSERIANHHEVIGYQADIGPGWFGALYDESRRRRLLAEPDAATRAKALAAVGEGGWHDYRVRAEGPRVTIWLNGVETVDYVEPDDAIAREGVIGVQIHGGMRGTIAYRDLVVTPL